MYAALNQKGQLIYANQAQSDVKQRWVCPQCGQPVRLRASPHYQVHFAHVIGVCGAKPTQRQVQESRWHRLGKRLLGAAYQQVGYAVELEHYFEATGQYADVYLPEGQQIIEFQCAVIGSSLLQQRQQQYARLGCRVCWLYDARILDNPRHNTRWKQIILQYNPRFHYYWGCLDVRQQCLVYATQLPLVYSRRWGEYEAQCLALTQLQMGNQAVKKTRVAMMRQPLFAYQQRYHSILNHGGKILQHLYQKGVHLNELPHFCLTHDYQCLLSKTQGWAWFGYIWSFLKPIIKNKMTISRTEWCALFTSMLATSLIELVQPPLCKRIVINDVAMAWWDVLCRHGILVPQANTAAFRVLSV